MAKNSAPSSAPESQPIDIEVNIQSISTRGSVLAKASVTLGGCFAVRGIKIVNSSNGLFASMPGYQTAKGYRDTCFHCTQEFHQRFQKAVLAAYRQELAQLHEPQSYERPRQREKTAFEARAAPGPQEEAPPEGPGEEAPEPEEGPSPGGIAMQ